jgi:hypothetical protein
MNRCAELLDCVYKKNQHWQLSRSEMYILHSAKFLLGRRIRFHVHPDHEIFFAMIKQQRPSSHVDLHFALIVDRQLWVLYSTPNDKYSVFVIRDLIFDPTLRNGQLQPIGDQEMEFIEQSHFQSKPSLSEFINNVLQTLVEGPIVPRDTINRPQSNTQEAMTDEAITDEEEMKCVDELLVDDDDNDHDESSPTYLSDKTLEPFSVTDDMWDFYPPATAN